MSLFRRRFDAGFVVLASAALAGCATGKSVESAAPTVTVEADPETRPGALSENWRELVLDPDLDRLGRLDAAWSAALTEAHAAKRSAAIKEDGSLLDPAAALPRAAPPPGSYLCRTIKLGTANGTGPAYTAYKPFFCYIAAEDALLILTKQTGSQRPAGRLWSDGDTRLVFLGAMELGEEKAPPAYGEDAKRDVVGVVERVGPFRWRLVMPWPRQESKLDVLELVPAPVQ